MIYHQCYKKGNLHYHTGFKRVLLRAIGYYYWCYILRIVKTHNRIAGGFSPPASTTPRMRVRTGRFLRGLKDHHKMAAFNAGYETNRQDNFTRSGAISPLRLVRLARCRRFGPSPCPTHYGGHLATMPSADFCPITPDVTARRAARVTLGSGGNPSAFGITVTLYYLHHFPLGLCQAHVSAPTNHPTRHLPPCDATWEQAPTDIHAGRRLCALQRLASPGVSFKRRGSLVLLPDAEPCSLDSRTL